MARALTPQDACTIMTALLAQATGQAQLTAVNSSTFVSAGETVLNTGVENTLNSISIVIGKTLVGVKPYNAKLKLLQEENTGLYTSRIRKFNFYDKGSKEAGWVNTDKHLRNLYNGYDNTAQGSSVNSSVGTMWEQDKPVTVEVNFGGCSVWDFELTYYPDQLKAAFRGEQEFLAFWNGLITAKKNEIEQTKENWNRMALLNMIAGTKALESVMPGSVCNLTAEFNAKYGTAYTSAQLRSTYLKEFAQFLAYKIPQMSDHMAERTIKYHWSPSVTRDGVTYTNLLKNTPKADQRLFLNSDIVKLTRATVFPSLFNPEYLDIKNYEPVDYWQAIDAYGMTEEDARRAITVKPAVPNTSNPAEQTTTSDPVVIDCVIGVLFDKDACVTNFQFEGANTTPMEARKKYQNTWFHNMKNIMNDFCENRVIFIMADPPSDNG